MPCKGAGGYQIYRLYLKASASAASPLTLKLEGLEDSKINEPKKVKSLNNPIHDDLVTYKFSDHSEITSTFDHPFYVKDKGIASYLPAKTNLLYSLGSKVAKQIEVGDFVFNLDHSEVEIVDTIEVSPRKETETFIIHVEDNNNFYAEGILVHNKQE